MRYDKYSHSVSIRSRSMSWKEEVLKTILKNPKNYSSRYLNKYFLVHYSSIFKILKSKFKDEFLNKAGFLHGLPFEQINNLDSDLISNDTLQILKGYEALCALDSSDPDLINHLGVNIIPFLHDQRSILLFIYDILNHLDPKNKATEWTDNFTDFAIDFPKISLKIHYDSNLIKKENSSFLCRVLSKISELVGLWTERNVFDNFSLLYKNPERFYKLVKFAIQMNEKGGICKEIENIVKKKLSGLEIKSISWRWHHIATLDREISANLSESNWHSNLYRCGYVTVITNDYEDCYRAIFLLHKELGCRHNQLHDRLWDPTKNRYRAIHTLLHAPPEIQEKLKAIPVRIIPSGALVEMISLVKNPEKILHEINKNKISNGGKIVIFTPDGRPIELEQGSTILNFASKLCGRFVAYLTGAYKNGKRVDILEPLSHGDVVFLDLKEQPCPLPKDWEKKVPISTIKSIRANFRHFFRPLVINTGRNYLLEQLIASGIKESIRISELDSWVEENLKPMKEKYLIPTQQEKSLHIHEWWYLQLGIMVMHKRGESHYYERPIEESLFTLFIRNLIKTILSKHEFELDYSSELSHLDGEIIFCNKCYPSHDDELIATHNKGITTLHRVNAFCSKGGVEVTRLSLTSQAKYFVIETNNRIGVGADILKIFQKHDIDLSEVIARRYGYARAVVRLQMNFVDKGRIESISKELSQLDGINQVLDPYQPCQPVLEADLPPRQIQSYRIPQGAPYIVGPPIDNDEYFYGMKNKLNELYILFQNVCNYESERSLGVLVYGPKRTGKSSLVKCFLREIKRFNYPKCLTLYMEATRGQTWTNVSKNLKKTLLNEVRSIERANRINLPFLESEKIESILDLVQEELNIPFVIAIDEIIGLIETSTKSGEVHKLYHFLNDIIKRPRRLIFWIGPEAPLRSLTSPIQQILEGAEPIKVEPLDFDATLQLIQAEKLSPQYNIEIDTKQANEIYRLTQGQPYQTSLLGKYMWNSSYRPGINKVKYTDSALKKAIDEVIEFHLPFNSVVQIRSDLDKELLKILSRHRKGVSGITLNMLKYELNKKGKNENLSIILDSLDYLNAIGATTSYFKKNIQFWKVFSPLTRQYLRSKLY